MNEELPLLHTREGAIALLTFNRPQALNAVDVPTVRAFLAACKAIAADGSVRVIVLRGAGRAFVAGGDLMAFRSAPLATAQALIEPINEALLILNALPQPVIASLHGAVAGAGVSLALACDLALAADDAVFNLAYAKVGASPDCAGSWSLPRIVGLRRALEIALLADNVDAAEALRLGLVNRVVPAARLEAETMVLARRLADGPAFAYGQIKRLLYDGFDRTLAQQLEAEKAAFCACAQTSDFSEALTAFAERRKPHFTGR